MKYSNNTINQTNSRKKYLFITLAMLLLAAAMVFYYQKVRDSSNNDIATNTVTEYEEKIDLSPPTEEEQQAAEDNKQRLIDESNQQSEPTPPPADGSKRNAVPVFGFLQQAQNKNVEANGYITETIEDSGTCALTLEKDGTKVTNSKQAMPDAQSTICGLITIDRSRLSPGTWKATLTYESAKFQGTSEERTINIE